MSDPDGWVRLNVGGEVLLTTRATLCSVKESLLARMFAETNVESLPKDANGAVLIDADPRYFVPLLNYLRRGELHIDTNISHGGVLSEAKHFGLSAVVQQIEEDDRDELEESALPQLSALTWDDIGGLSGAKRELRYMAEHANKYRDVFEQWGVSPTKKVLLYGPPGCGKTLLARVTANTMGARFIMVKCPELLTGDGDPARLVMEKFALARRLQPCVMFMEEFEVIARVPADPLADRLISQLALCLDSVNGQRDNNMFVVAATNRPDLVEPALFRPGRFDQLVYVPLPDLEAREDILRSILVRVPTEEALDVGELGKMTEGLSGADLKEICERACKFAVRRSISEGSAPEATVVKRTHFKTMMRYARRSVIGQNELYEQFNRVLREVSNKYPNFTSSSSSSHRPRNAARSSGASGSRLPPAAAEQPS